MSPESLPTKSAVRRNTAAVVSKSRPSRSIRWSAGTASRSGPAWAVSSPPPVTTTAAPARGAPGAVSRRASSAKRSAGQTLAGQLAVGARTSTGRPAGIRRSAASSWCRAVQRSGAGGGSSPSVRPSSRTRWSAASDLGGSRRSPARRNQASAERRRSTTRSQRSPAQALQSHSQCRLAGFLRITRTRRSPGTSAKIGAAAGPQATVISAPGWRSISQPSRPVESTASPMRVAVTKRMFTGGGSRNKRIQ